MDVTQGDQPAIDVRNVRVVRRSKTILDGLTCQIERGTCTTIIGPNGSGKTTFARTLLGQVFLNSGMIRVLGRQIGRTNIRALRKRIGLINPMTDSSGIHFSGAVLDADLSVTEAVITGFFGTVGLYDQPTAEQTKQAITVLEQIGLKAQCDMRFGLLSTGEQRRAMIARSLVHIPELLIFDEPTAGLDLVGREQVLATIDLILSSRQRPTVLMITHQIEELPPKTSQILMMNHGKFVAADSPQTILTSKRLTSLFGCEISVRNKHGRYWTEVRPQVWRELLKNRVSD